jgi:glycosyltransferase involved in cell wall biosynthesis
LIARVRARVNYLYFPADGLLPDSLSAASLTASHFWKALRMASELLPDACSLLPEMRDEDARHVYHALQLACDVRRKDIHHLHAPFANDGAKVARLAARFAGVTYSLTARAKELFHEAVKTDDLRRKLQDADGIITISDFHLDWLRKTFGPVAARAQRIYNGLDLEEFRYHSPEDRPPVILAVGRLVEKKGFDDLIEACALLAERGCSFHCRIIGTGTLKAELEDQIERHDLRRQVVLVGMLPQGAVIKEMHNAAVLAAPCVISKDGDRDGLPNVIQEALALGTPVVSTDVTGIPDVLRDGETGLMVPQHDPRALADALARLLENPGLRVRLATKGRQLMEAEFDIRRNSERRRRIFRAAARLSVPVAQEVG